MIISNLQNSSRVESLHPLFKKLFDYVKTHDLLHTPCGRIELEGDNLFINNVNPTCVTADKQVLELHREYIDVHILLEGNETIGWKAIEDLTQEKQPKATVHYIPINRPHTSIYYPASLLSSFPKTRMLRSSVKEKSENLLEKSNYNLITTYDYEAILLSYIRFVGSYGQPGSRHHLYQSSSDSYPAGTE